MEIIQVLEKHLNELAKLQKMYMQHHAKLDDYFMFEEDMSTLWTGYMKKFLSQKDNIILVAVENLKIIGYITGSIVERPPIYKTKRVGRIGDVFVLPEYRRKGVFSKLLTEVLSWMKSKGIEYVEHPVAAKNKLGRIAWRRRGFEDTTVFTRRKIV